MASSRVFNPALAANLALYIFITFVMVATSFADVYKVLVLLKNLVGAQGLEPWTR
jgi:type III secretory pathway component EscR